MSDLSNALQEQIVEAHAKVTPLTIQGSNSKGFYGVITPGQIVSTLDHCGVVEYEPTELVITVRAGTRLQDIEKILAEQNQMLPFEPPHFAETATIGGTVASGLSGPRRPFAGSLRDAVLGCKLLNGKGEIIDFGGTVMKNVAGYDVSRVIAGSLGCLGVILEVSLRVLPKPSAEKTMQMVLTEAQALEKMNAWCGRDFPLSALGYWDGLLFARLSGAEKSVAKALERLGGDELNQNESHQLWQGLREQQLPFFNQTGNLWRLSIKPSTSPIDCEEACLIDWGGAQRWLFSNREPTEIFELAKKHQGHATLWRTTQNEQTQRFQPLPKPHLILQQRLKAAFDPQGLFNRGRMYPEL